MRYVLPLICLCALAQQPQVQQQPKPEAAKPEEKKCTIEGKVLNGSTNEPLRKAQVIAFPMGGQPNERRPSGAVTDAEGKFKLTEIPAGQYSLMAQRTGFARDTKQKQPLVTLKAGETVSDVSLKLTPHGIITGRVLDEDGEPVANTQVQVMSYAYINGKKTLVPAQGGSMTNDRGEYRIFGLSKGEYFVSAIARDQMQMYAGMTNANSVPSYATTYYPSSASETGAMRVNVAPGGEVSAIDIRLVRMRSVSVKGTVGGGSRRGVTTLMMTPVGGPSPWASMSHTMADAKGNFVFTGVKPGSYRVTAMAMDNSQPQARASVRLEVGDSDVENVMISISEAAKLSGRVTVEGKRDLGELKDRPLNINLSPAEDVFGMDAAFGTMKENGTFELNGVAAERYRVALYALPESYYLKSIAVGPTELEGNILDFSKTGAAGELSITLSPNGAHVEGTVQDGDKKPAPSATVIAVPERRDAEHRYKNAASDQYGHFSIKGMAPGIYKLFAIDTNEPHSFTDPEFFKPFEDRGVPVELKESAHETKELTLIDADGERK